MQNIVYHGSNVEVPVPRVLQNGFYKDFGYGFYCTNLFKQAKRWAMTKKGNSVINRYKYVQDSGLKVLKFEEMTDEWLDFVVNCRRGIEHDYDIIEGPMADDQIWNYVEAIIRVYNDELCEVIDNYNCSAFYEPSYVIARAYQNGGF